MYYIKDKNGEPVATSDPNEVTKENFLVEPDGAIDRDEELSEDQKTGEKKMLVNQINSLNPGDADFCFSNWRKDDIDIEMLHDPRPELKGDGVEEKLAKLKAQMNAGKAEEEAKVKAEEEAKAKAEAEAKAKAEAEAKAKAEAEVKKDGQEKKSSK